MAGFVPYGNGGFYPYSSLAPSSLSALAPPFTVDRSVPKPMSSPLDVTETPYIAPMNSSLHNWLPSHPTTMWSNFFANPTPDFNSIPSSNAYGYAGLQTVEISNTNLPPLNTITTGSSSAFKYDQSFDAAATSFVEAKSYYPSYPSSTVPSVPPIVVPNQPSYDWPSTTHFTPLDSSSHKDYAQNPSDPKHTTQCGLWEWEQGKQGDFSGNFCSKKTGVSGSSLYKNYMNQDSSCEEASHSINILGWEKLGGSVSAEHLGDKSLVAKSSKFIPADFSKSVTGSFSAVPETHPKASSSQFVTNTTSCKTPYSVFSEQKQNDASMDDISSTAKSSSAFATRIPATGTKSSEPESLFKMLNFRSDAGETDRGDYYPSIVQVSRLLQVSEGDGGVSSSQLNSLLGINDSFFAERNEELSKNRSLNKNPWDHMIKAKPGIENPHVSPGGFNVALNTNETVNSFPSSSDNVDPNNPAVDSPCWKGVPGSRFSPFESSEGGVPEQIKKLEDCCGLHFPVPLMFPLNAAENVSSQKPIKNTVEYHDIEWLENGLTLPLKRYSIENSAFGEHKLDDTVKTTYDSETSHDRGPQSYRDVLHKSGNGDNSFGLFGHSHTMEQGHDGEDGLATEIKKTTLSCGPGVKLNVSDTMEYGSSHVPSHAVENILCSSVEDAPTELSKSDGEDSMPKVDAQMLVDTMNSLSQLLLSNCSYGLVQLNKNDTEVIKSVISNLHICISKNSEKLSPTQEMPSFQQNTSQCNGEYTEHNKVVSADRAPLASASNIQDEVFRSVSVKSDKNMAKEDKMTQDIKEILSESFHAEETDPQALLYKNLWLEAEALLCSINYKARFNRVKIEMDKCKAEKSKDVFEYKADMMKQSMSEASPDSNPVNPLTRDAQDCPTSNLQDLPVLSLEDDVLARFRILRDLVENTNSIGAANGGESCSKFSEPIKVDSIPPEVNGSSSSHGISIPDSPTSDTVGMTDDYDEASVMARFHIIRDRVEKSKFISSAMVESSSSNVCLEPKTDIIAPNASDVSAPEVNFWGSSISVTTSQSNDCEGFVQSRLNILKSRIENYADLHSEGQLLPDPKMSAVTPNTSDSSMPEFIQDSPRSSTTGQANDSEASVMSRLQILKSRLDNSYMHSEGPQLPESGGLGYAGERNRLPFISKRSEGGSSELKEQTNLQSHEANSSEDNMVAAEELYLLVDGPPTDYRKINSPRNLLPAGCHDSSTSDWEHVVKEEIWEQN